MVNDPRAYIYCLIFINYAAVAAQVKPGASRFSDVLTRAIGLERISVMPDAYLRFKRAARLAGLEATMPADEFQHIYQLEKMFRVSDMIVNSTGFIRGNASAALVHQRLATALLAAKNKEAAIGEWRSIDAQVAADPQWKEYYTIAESTGDEIGALHQSVQAYEASAESTLIPDLVQRIYGATASSHKSCDDRQVAQTPHPLRTLSRFDKTGIGVVITEEGRQKLLSVAHMPLPLIESAKNHRILSISGLKGSKVSVLVHDHFDHYFTFKFLEREGILGRYASFMQQVGNPPVCDILSREAELVASIAYDYRYTRYPRFKQPTLFQPHDIERIIKEGHVMSDNQANALKILHKKAHHGEFQDRLARIVSGVGIELLQQRAKNGVIKVLDKDKYPVDILRALDPEYIAFIVEAVDTFDKHPALVRQHLRNTQLAVEDILHRATTSKTPFEASITAARVESFTGSSHTVPAHRVDWIERNLGAISDRNSAQ